MKTKVAFVCVHNSCRSQIAEALTKRLGSEYIEAYSAGTELKDRINPDAVRIIKEVYNIDMEEKQSPKLIEDIPEVDYVITMGCNVYCPVLPFEYKVEDWGLDDPTGKSDEEFKKTIEIIERNVINLIEEVKKSHKKDILI